MPSLKDIKIRIKSVKDVKQITRAMKMVAASKLLRSEGKMLYTRSFVSRLEKIAAFAISRNQDLNNLLWKGHPQVRKTGLLVLSGDRGLCGSFNANLIKKASQKFEELGGAEKVTLLGIGKKANVFFKRKQAPLSLDISGIFGKVTFQESKKILNPVIDLFQSGALQEIFVIHNRHKAGEPIGFKRLLPLVTPAAPEARADYIYEPTPQEMLETFIPYFLNFQFYSLLLESETAEFFARMVAMDSASNNATELIGDLTLEYNRARQAAITRELLDIVGGAEAIQ
jgi:F-type H+-transporting ATPase subunit gamma